MIHGDTIMALGRSREACVPSILRIIMQTHDTRVCGVCVCVVVVCGGGRGIVV